MPYAAKAIISKDPLDGGIDITDEQYREGLEGMLLGGRVVIDNGFAVVYEPEPEPEPEDIGVQLFEHRNSGDSSEIQSSLPIGGDTQLCYRETISDVKQGEVIVVMAEVEFSNPNAHNVGVWSQAKLGADSNDRGGLEISESNGRNISPNMHHDTHVIVGTIVADRDYSSRTINIWARAASNYGGSAVKTEQDYGRLSVLRFR